jgi:hypothetical protein
MFAQAQDPGFYNVFSHLFQPSGLPFLIPIVAILVGGILGSVKMVIRHRERMAMIEHGMNPDSKEETPAGENSQGS